MWRGFCVRKNASFLFRTFEYRISGKREDKACTYSASEWYRLYMPKLLRYDTTGIWSPPQYFRCRWRRGTILSVTGYSGALKAPVRYFGNHLSGRRKAVFWRWLLRRSRHPRLPFLIEMENVYVYAYGGGSTEGVRVNAVIVYVRLWRRQGDNDWVCEYSFSLLELWFPFIRNCDFQPADWWWKLARNIHVTRLYEMNIRE